MAWVIGVLVVLFIIGAMSSAASKTEEIQKKIEFNEIAKTRVDAYVDYLRRTSSRADFSRMTDLELRDLIGQKIRNYKSQTSGATSISGFALFLGMCFSAWQGVAERSWAVFFVFSVMSLFGAVVMVMFFTKRIDKEFENAGFEPERLKVEE